MSPAAASPISTTTVVEFGATDPSTGSNAAGACPETTTNDAELPRCVTGMPARAGAASAELIPGTISNGIPAATSASASSPPRPNTKGSPPFKPHDALAAPRGAHQQLIDQGLADGGAAGALAYVDALGLARERENVGVDERIVENHVGGSQAGSRAPRQQLGIARAGAHERHRAGTEVLD